MTWYSIGKKIVNQMIMNGCLFHFLQKTVDKDALALVL